MTSSSSGARAWRPASLDGAPAPAAPPDSWRPLGLAAEAPVASEAPAAPARTPQWMPPALGGEGESPEATAARGLEEAYRRGYEEGLEAGASLGRDGLRPALDALEHVTRSFAASREQLLRDLEANLSALAVAVARKIVLREMSVHPEILQDLVARGLALMKPDSPITVKLHPEDLAPVEAELHARGKDAPFEIRWTADPETARGGFLIEGAERIVDGRLDESLRALYERLAYD